MPNDFAAAPALARPTQFVFGTRNLSRNYARSAAKTRCIDLWTEDDGRLVGRQEGEDVSIQTYLKQFVEDNPELLPARITSGMGTGNSRGSSPAGSAGSTFDLDRIRPGMNADELERVRQEIARVANQSLK